MAKSTRRMGKGEMKRTEARYRSYILTGILEETQTAQCQMDERNDLTLHLLKENTNLWKQLVSVQRELAEVKQRLSLYEPEKKVLQYCTSIGHVPTTTTSTFGESKISLQDQGF